jgi:hypothetical protein
VGFPQYGWKHRHPTGTFRWDFSQGLFSALAVHSDSGLTCPVLWNGGEPTGPWLSAVYHARASERYYGLMRQSDGLRPASLRGLFWSVFALAGCPSHLPFFALSYFARMPRSLPRWRLDFS